MKTAGTVTSPARVVPAIAETVDYLVQRTDRRLLFVDGAASAGASRGRQ
jgi:hypothetical protein